MKAVRLTNADGRSQSEQRKNDLARIHIAKKDLKLADGHYRAIIEGIMKDFGLSGKASAANLNAAGRRALITAFHDMGWGQQRRSQQGTPHPETEHRYEVAGSPGMITPAQAGKIAHLEDELGWHNPARLQGFIRRTLKASKAVGMLTNRQASALISAMQNMLAA